MSQDSRTIVGLDVSDRITHVFRTVRGDPDRGERSKVPTRPAKMREFLESLPAGSQVVLEVGTHSRWIDRLVRASPGGHESVVANARRLRFIYAGTCKTDRLDAEALARVACLQPRLLHPIHHRSEQGQRDLGVLQARDHLVQARTKLVNGLRSQVKSDGHDPLAACDSERFLLHHRATILALQQDHLEALVRALEGIQAQIEVLDAKIAALAKRYEAVPLLTEVFGVGVLTALAFLLVLEDPDRFPRTRRVGAYLGLVPRLDQSGEVSRQGGITKAGHPLLRRLLVQASHRILRRDGPDSVLRRYGWRLMARAAPADKGARKRAVIAVARKLSVVLLHLWKTGEVYELLPSPA